MPRDTPEEGARYEHRRQHQGDGDDRPRHFVHGSTRRFARLQPLFQPTFDVLHDDDSVIDDDADGQYEAEQRQVVQAET